MSGTETTVRANFDGVSFIGGAAHLSYSKIATRRDGKSRPVSSSIRIRPEDVAHIQTDFIVGEQIEITEETDWSQDDLPVVLTRIAKVGALPASQAA